MHGGQQGCEVGGGVVGQRGNALIAGEEGGPVLCRVWRVIGEIGIEDGEVVGEVAPAKLLEVDEGNAVAGEDEIAQVDVGVDQAGVGGVIRHVGERVEDVGDGGVDDGGLAGVAGGVWLGKPGAMVDYQAGVVVKAGAKGARGRQWEVTCQAVQRGDGVPEIIKGGGLQAGCGGAYGEGVTRWSNW